MLMTGLFRTALVVGALMATACKDQEIDVPAGPKLDERWKPLKERQDGTSVIMDTESMVNNGRPTVWFRRIDDAGKVKREFRLAFLCEKREYVTVEMHSASGENGNLRKQEVSGRTKSIKPESYQEEAFGIVCKKN